MREIVDNPLVELVLRFQDGQMGVRMDRPVPQFYAMAALGQFAARVGTELNITLPRQPKELVAEAIEGFLAAQAHPIESFPRELHQWSSHDLATAILDAVTMPEPEMVAACNAAAQAIRDDMPHAALLPLEAAIANAQARGLSHTEGAR